MIQNKKFMHDAMKRVKELKQETIEKSKKIPNSEAIVKTRLKELLSFQTQTQR